MEVVCSFEMAILLRPLHVIMRKTTMDVFTPRENLNSTLKLSEFRPESVYTFLMLTGVKRDYFPK